MKPNKTGVGKRIRAIRKKLGYSLGEFGAVVSQSPAITVKSWERGISIPKKNKLEVIAILGNTTPELILHGNLELYVHELINKRLQMNFPKQLKPMMLQALKEQGVGIGDDLKIIITAQMINDEFCLKRKSNIAERGKLC